MLSNRQVHGMQLSSASGRGSDVESTLWHVWLKGSGMLKGPGLGAFKTESEALMIANFVSFHISYT